MAEENQLAQAVEAMIGPDKEFSSNQAMAEKIGVSYATIQRIRHGHIPSLTTLRKMADAIPEWGLVQLQRWAGVPVVDPDAKHDEWVRAVINAGSLLTPAEQKAVRALINNLVASRREEVRETDGSTRER